MVSIVVETDILGLCGTVILWSRRIENVYMCCIVDGYYCCVVNRHCFICMIAVYTACKSQAYCIMLSPRLSVTHNICLQFMS